MNSLEANDVLRIAVISGLIGFGVFCACFSLSVWFRRNKSRRNIRARLGFLVMVIGLIVAVSNWAHNEFSSRKGIVGGQDLFVVHARRNVTTNNLAPEGPIEKGDRLVEFLPPALDGQLAVIDSHIQQAQARIDYFGLRALPVDMMLLQRQAQLRQQVDQASITALDIQKSYRETERARLDDQMQYAEKLSQIELQSAAEKLAFASASLQIEIAERAMHRAAESRRDGIGTVNAAEDKATTYLTQRLAHSRAQANLQSLEGYRAILDESYGRTLHSLATQVANLDIDITTNQQTSVQLNHQLAELERAVADDRLRAAQATDRERDAAVHELEALKAERVNMLAVTQVKAPFSGEVVYRNPAPGFAPENTPVLALSAGSGFVARIWVPTEDLKAIQKAGKVKIGLEQPVLNKFFVGEYRSFEDAPYETNRVIAKFDAKLPLEAITLLASAGNPVQVELLWRPDLLESYPFLGGLCLAVVGCCAVMLSGRRSGPEAPNAGLQIEAGMLELRLRETARDLHALLRQGGPDDNPDLVRGAVRLVEQIGDPARRIFRAEIIFDEDLDQALFKWMRQNHDPALMEMLHQIRRLTIASAAA